MSTNLQNRALCAHLVISAWSARKIDREATALVTSHYGADSDAGIFTLQQIPKEAFARIKSSDADLRNSHYQLTLPWTNTSRIFLISQLDKYREAIRAKINIREEWVREFLRDYDRIHLPRAREKNRGLHRESDLPTAEQVKSKFRVVSSISPVPNAADWRVDVSESEMKLLRANLESDIAAATTAATQDIHQRIVDVLGHFVEKVSAFEPGTENARAVSAFKQATVSHLSELADLLPGLNITGDKRIDNLSKVLRDLARHDAKSLKEDKILRTEKVKTANEILAKVNEFFA